jgi:hypothetical protein
VARRVACTFVIGVIAGSAVNWLCLFSCAATGGVAVIDTETCHRSEANGPLMTSADDCRKGQAAVVPFVQSQIRPELSGFVALPAPGSAIPAQPANRPASRADSSQGPPHGRAVIPLRI